MKLQKLTISNYRNLYNKTTLTFENYTVLVGPNNQGKTNCLRAIRVMRDALLVACNADDLPRLHLSFESDYPKSMQSRNSIPPIIFEPCFLLSEEEKNIFLKRLRFSNNGHLDLRIEISCDFHQNSKFRNKSVFKISSIKIKGKFGKGAKTYNENISDVCRFIIDYFDFVYIPTIRSEDESLDILRRLVSIKIKDLNSDNDYLEQINKIREKEESTINTIKENLIQSLKEYIPTINDVKLVYDGMEPTFTHRWYGLDFVVDDGVETSIKSKGSGIISLITLALIQGQSNDSSMIAIEEPESHLHADAIHTTVNKLIEVSHHRQVVVSTHNPAFINESNLSSIFLVEKGSVKMADNREEVRNALGLLAKDSLLLSPNIIVVEGTSDVRFIQRIIHEYSPGLDKMIENGSLSVMAAYSSSKILDRINLYKTMQIHYFAVFDGDQAGKKEFEELNDTNRSFLIQRSGLSNGAELEDIIPAPVIVKVLTEFGMNISKNDVKKRKRKFNEFLNECATKFGVCIDKKMLDVKTRIIDCFCVEDFSKIEHTLIDIYKSMITKMECCFSCSNQK